MYSIFEKNKQKLQHFLSILSKEIQAEGAHNVKKKVFTVLSSIETADDWTAAVPG